MNNGLHGSKQLRPKVEWQQLAVVRSSSPPSIPSHNHVFGYEEDLEGELVQQPNPDTVFSGVKQDTVGPGQYEVRGMPSRRTGTNWHSSRASRFVFTESEAKNSKVGPGTYDVVRGVGQSKSKAKGTSSFTSAVPKSVFVVQEKPSRLQEDEEEYCERPPGPGSYNPKSGAFEQRPFPNSVQQFGATASRFGTSNPLGTNLGPGYYGEGGNNVIAA